MVNQSNMPQLDINNLQFATLECLEMQELTVAELSAGKQAENILKSCHQQVGISDIAYKLMRRIN